MRWRGHAGHRSITVIAAVVVLSNVTLPRFDQPRPWRRPAPRSPYNSRQFYTGSGQPGRHRHMCPVFVHAINGRCWPSSAIIAHCRHRRLTVWQGNVTDKPTSWITNSRWTPINAFCSIVGHVTWRNPEMCGFQSPFNWLLRYLAYDTNTIRYKDITCARKGTISQLSLPYDTINWLNMLWLAST